LFTQLDIKLTSKNDHIPILPFGITRALVDCVPIKRILGIVQYPVMESPLLLLIAKDAHVPLFAKDQLVMETGVVVTYV
jgi:hypothetical protein